MKRHIKEFITKSMLGREIKLNCQEDIVKRCISKAYDDMMTVGRYYKLNDKDKLIQAMYDLLEQQNYEFSREMISCYALKFGFEIKEKTSNGKIDYVTSYGLAQKVVNMTYKYLYVFNDTLQLNIDFRNCDCPLDSIILAKLKTKATWSKISKETYVQCQEEINIKVAEIDDELKEIGRMSFDFMIW